MKFLQRFFSFLAIVLVIGLIALINQNSSNYTTQNAISPILQPTLKLAIQQSFQKGNVEVVYPFFDELISICIEDVEEIYLAYNAQTALQNFFTTHPPAQFKINHTGENKNATKAYFIGDYEDTTQRKFRVYILTENGLVQAIEISRKMVTS